MDEYKSPMFPGQVSTIPGDTAMDLTNVTLRIVTILVGEITNQKEMYASSYGRN